ncbi:hypothetical protein CL649_00240 [bacterium]|nr:hypothetical protein [bacterium]|tara:strand:+ start:9025 stop:15471 length:6447 start_codon:yes stop_codon:yes gene_type:complete
MAGIAATQFNIFGPASQSDITVGYISSARGFVQNVSLCEANDYEKENPGTSFIFRTRDKVEYLGIEQVNKLVPSQLSPIAGVDGCKIDMEHSCDPTPFAEFHGGGGVGAFANPVIGEDGGVLSLDITHPGYGYQYPPKVEVKDECGIGAGAVARVRVSDGDNCVEQLIHYMDDMDENVPEICADTSVPYGRVWGVDGQDTGVWDPEKYTRYAEDPALSEIDKYIESLKNLQNPWWTARGQLNLQKITKDSTGEITNVGYAVSTSEWSDFMNLYGVSPVEPSDEIGSAHGGEVFDFEWNLDFPWGGEYIFRGLYDGQVGYGDLFIDNQIIGTLNPSNGLTEPIKYEVGIATSKILGFKLHNNPTTKKQPIQPDKKIINREAGGKFIKEGSNYFYKVGGNDLVDIDFEFFWDKSIGVPGPPPPPEVEQATFWVYTAGGDNCGLKFTFTAVDGSHSFEIKADDYVDGGAPAEKKVIVKTNVDYNVVSSRRNGTTEQGCLQENRFGRRGIEKDQGTSKCIFCDKVGSADDDDDLQIKTTNVSGVFTAGGGISSGSSRHDSFAITYKLSNSDVVNTPKERPAITKLTIQTEKDPLVFEVPKTDRQPASTGEKQKPWVKSHQNDTNWVRNNNTAFLRSHAVFPVHDSSLNGKQNKGIWHVNITTPGNYTVEVQSDDTASIDWDSNRVGDTKWIDQRVKSFTIANVSAGIHKLSATVRNNPKYGTRWRNNPGGVAWVLKNPSGTVVASSLSPFNDSITTDTLGKGGKDYQQKGSISKKGNFKNGRKYRVTFDRQSYTKVPLIGDTGPSKEEDDQLIDFFDRGIRDGNTLKIITPKNVIFAARNAYQLSEGDTVVVYDENVKTSPQTIFNTLQWMGKADRRLWKTTNKGGLLGKYGIAPYDTALALPNMPYAGDHPIVWSNVNFPASTNYNIKVHVDDDVKISIGNQVTFTKIGFTHGKDATTYDSFGDAVEAVGQGKFGHTGETTHTYYIEAGTYTITAVLSQIPGGRWPTTNPMALAIDIQAEVAYQTVADPKSWNENPMGVALSIEAPVPAPPPAIVPPLLEEGECPTSPIFWHTRMKPEGANWYPVKFKYWDKWMNKYAISPIPPLNSAGSDGTGNADGWKQTWIVNAPYEGEYTLKGTVDNFGIIEVDGVEVASRKDDPDVAFVDEEFKRAGLDVAIKPANTEDNSWPQQTKFYMSEGEHTVSATISNFRNYEVKKQFITQKVFSTKDWQSAAPIKSKRENKPHGIMFTQESGKYYLAAYGNDRVDADLGYIWDALEGDTPPPPPETEQATFFVYTSGGDNCGLKFRFTARDGKHSFEIKADDFVDNGAAKEIKVTVRTNVDYDVVSSRNNGSTEQGCLAESTFGRRGTEKDHGTSKCIFCDKVGSRDDDDDLQVKTTNVSGVFTAGGGISSGSSRHDSFAITYKLSNIPVSNTSFIPPSVVKVTVQTETDPLVFEVPKIDSQPANTSSGGQQKPWVPVNVWPYVYPSDNDPLRNQWHTGEWTINITTPGDYKLEFRADDRCKASWDGNTLFGTTKERKLTVRNVSAGIHKLSASVWNKGKYGRTWKSNPGALKWLLKDASGTVLATSRDPFNDSKPSSNTGKGGDQWQQNGNIKKRGTFKAGKKYEITYVGGYGRRKDGSAILQKPVPNILESGWMSDDKSAVKSNPKMAFKNPWDILETISVYQMSSATTEEELYADTTRNGVTYSGPALFNYRDKRYGPFMNENGISPDYPKVGGMEQVDYTFTNVNFPVTGEYEFIFQNDHSATLYLDDQKIGTNFFIGQEHSTGRHSIDHTGKGLGKKITVNKGRHTLTVKPTVYTEESGGPIGFIDALFRKPSDDYFRGSAEFLENPSGFAIGITRLVEDVPEAGTPAAAAASGKSWYQNPIGINAIIIPPPCKKIVCGKGRVIDPLVDDPGCGFDPPTRVVIVDPPPDDPTDRLPPPTYPVRVIPTEVVVINPGINYSTGIGTGGCPPPGDPTIFVPDELRVLNGGGAEFIPDFDPFGRITRVGIATPGNGLTRNPEIKVVRGDDPDKSSRTGVNFEAKIVTKVIRDPMDGDPDKLIQVTDLVGLKQTGYIQGRAYYGSVYYKNSIPYAGITETAGTQIQVYATLQESIDAQATTPPSAIQRQGTDVTSNDPRLNIPGTPDNLI